MRDLKTSSEVACKFLIGFVWCVVIAAGLLFIGQILFWTILELSMIRQVLTAWRDHTGLIRFYLLGGATTLVLVFLRCYWLWSREWFVALVEDPFDVVLWTICIVPIAVIAISCAWPVFIWVMWQDLIQRARDSEVRHSDQTSGP